MRRVLQRWLQHAGSSPICAAARCCNSAIAHCNTLRHMLQHATPALLRAATHNNTTLTRHNNAIAHCNTLQHILQHATPALCALQHAAIHTARRHNSAIAHCNTLQHIMRRNEAHNTSAPSALFWRRVAENASLPPLQRTATHCNTMQHAAAHYNCNTL